MTDTSIQPVVTKINERLTNTCCEQNIPGLAVGIVRDQSLVWSAGFGLADIETGRQPDEHTISRVASITKTFTATAILQLRDCGLLDLDDPLTKHIPEFASAKVRAGTIEEVTIRRMLSHHSGMTTEAPLPCWDALEFPTRDEVIDNFDKTEIVIPQNSAFKYSNLAFGLLGEVIARVSGRPYFDYIHDEILGPLEMTSSVFEMTDDLRPRFAVGYMSNPFEDAPQIAPYAPLNGISACGQLHSTVHDLAKWISLQFCIGNSTRGGTQILQATTIEEMHRPQYLEPDWSVGYCLGWRANRVGHRVYHGHGGGIHGFASQILFSKPHQIGVICLANVWPHPGVLNTAIELMEMIVDHEESTSTQHRDRPAVPTPTEYKKLIGTYVASPGIPLNVEYRDGKLQLRRTPCSEYLLHVPAELEPDNKADTFIVRGGRGSGERITFSASANHDGCSFELGGFVYRQRITT